MPIGCSLTPEHLSLYFLKIRTSPQIITMQSPESEKQYQYIITIQFTDPIQVLPTASIISISKRTQSRITCCLSCHFALVSFNLEQFLSLFLALLTLTLLKIQASYFVECSSVGSVWCFLVIRYKLCILNKNITCCGYSLHPIRGHMIPI